MPHKTNWSTVKPSPRANEQLQASPFPSLQEAPGSNRSGVSASPQFRRFPSFPAIEFKLHHYQTIAEPESLALLGTGLLAVGGGWMVFSHRSVGGDDASQTCAVMAMSKPPTPLRRGCKGLTKPALWKATSIRS